jgi:tripartite-type tricarboxylate transporter receptor subunit TctC
MQRLTRMLVLVAGAIATTLISFSAQAQGAYPNRAIRITVPFPAGGGVDFVSRLVGQAMSENWGQPVLVENRPGGNQFIGAEAVARATPDGYTLLATIDGTFTMNPSLFSKMPYDPVKDFAPVSILTQQPMVLVGHPSVAPANLADLVAHLKGGAKLAYAHPALPAQLAGELFKSMAGVDVLAVPYKGGAPAMQDTLSGQVGLLFDLPSNVVPHIKAGKLKAYAQSTAKRSPLLPDVPTFQEAGLAGYVLGTWVGIAAPAGTPRDVITKLNAETTRILALPQVRDRLTGAGAEILATTPDEFARVVRDDTVKFDRIIKQAGIKLE